jgi:deoxycytidine triphosphate deaminase/intein/homing endonuclease
MGLKPDHWIRKMALEHGMIEPFVEKQMREGVISYGVSSYGYDMRIADEFKVFTDVYGAIVDPKNFSPTAFVDIKSEVCIIPPNSFALARSVEYFRIPRQVLTVCLGKCLTADTRVVDAETGAYLPIADAAIVQKTVSMRDWQLGVSAVSGFIPNGKRPVYELMTKMGLKIKATAQHPFRMLHGWTPLEDLKPGDRIAVARQIPVFGKTAIPDWEVILLGLMISEGQCHTPQHSPIYTTADTVLADLLERCVEAGLKGKVTYNGHYGYRLTNRIGRGGIAEHNRAYRWLQSYNLNVKANQKFVPQAIFTAPKESVRLFLSALFSGDGSIYFAANGGAFLEYYSSARRLVEDVHHLLLRFGILSLIREKKTQIDTDAYKIQITDCEQIRRFAEEIGFWPDSIKQRRLENEVIPYLNARLQKEKSNFDTLPREGWQIIRDAASVAQVSLRTIGVLRTNPSQSLPYNVAQTVAKATRNASLGALSEDGPVWDVVKSIEYVGEEEVYDLSVPDTQNFVANDLIVHNSTYARCGLIVNVTPFEPQWEGFVTLEISNTTPLPAKVYANEGIAQVLFFEADEECEVSYADKKGKYQAQTGVTPPKL